MAVTAAATPRIAIIGAGMSGIAAVVKLRRAGYTNLTVFEKTDRVGGTWRENRYPGLSCDIPSYFYQFTFAPNPDWSHRFAYGPEIQAYMERTAREFDVMSCVRFGCEVTALHYAAPQWRVSLGDGSEETFDVVLAATGVLHHPVVPDFPGKSDFAGESFHTARWPEALDLRGKRVGIIGTGSTSAQIVGAITEQVAHLSLFQRTPQWVFPLPQKAYSRAWKGLLRRVPALSRMAYWGYAHAIEQSFVRATLGSKPWLKFVDWTCRRHLRREVADPVLRAQLTPDYQAACKRMIFCSTFYPAMSRDNAALVTDGIERIEAAGVRTRNGTLHELDVLVYATGFKAANFILPTPVYGENGESLETRWQGSPRAHRGVAIPGFPNFWMIEGPTGPVGNISLVMVSEHQVDYVIAQLDEMRRRQVDTVVADEAAFADYNAAMGQAIQRTVWVTGGCQSWYLDASGTPNIYPWSPARYRREMQRPHFAEFRFARTADASAGATPAPAGAVRAATAGRAA